MSRSRQVLLTVCCVVSVVGVFGFLFPTVAWVGRTDLEIEFLITDSISGKAVSNARVDLGSPRELPEESQPDQPSLITDDDGRARTICRNCVCSGRRNRLLQLDTFVIDLPAWQFQVIADGFEHSKRIELDVAHYVQRVVRSQKVGAKLVVPVSLHRAVEQRVTRRVTPG